MFKLFLGIFFFWWYGFYRLKIVLYVIYFEYRYSQVSGIYSFIDQFSSFVQVTVLGVRFRYIMGMVERVRRREKQRCSFRLLVRVSVIVFSNSFFSSFRVVRRLQCVVWGWGDEVRIRRFQFCSFFVIVIVFYLQGIRCQLVVVYYQGEGGSCDQVFQEVLQIQVQ